LLQVVTMPGCYAFPDGTAGNMVSAFLECSGGKVAATIYSQST
jgi:hypothetical protein